MGRELWVVAVIGPFVGFRLTHGEAGMSGNFEAVRAKQAIVSSEGGDQKWKSVILPLKR